jgi:UPF0042 nucleotide-binding protein
MSGRRLRERLTTLSAPASAKASPCSWCRSPTSGIAQADVFDVRFGGPIHRSAAAQRARSVRAFVLDQPLTGRFLDFVRQFLELVLPGYEAEGRSRLTVAFGCTGGQHRSIAIAEEVGAQWRAVNGGPISIWHRELERS